MCYFRNELSKMNFVILRLQIKKRLKILPDVSKINLLKWYNFNITVPLIPNLPILVKRQQPSFKYYYPQGGSLVQLNNILH